MILLWLRAIPRLAWEALGIIVAALLIMWGKSCYDSRIIENAQKQQAVDSGRVHIGELKDSVRIRDSVRIKDSTRYTTVRTGALAAHPNDSSVTKLVQSCDQIIVSCADANKARQIVIDTQDVQIKRLTTMKAVTLPRLSFFGEVLRDIPNAEWVGRAGVDFRIAGPISVLGAVEARPKATKANALVGLRYTFQ
jgi:hypothetical protein